MHKHVVVNILGGVRRIVHKYKVTRIAGHEQVTHAVDGTLVESPAHARSSRLRQVRLGFHKEVVTEVNIGDNARLHLGVLNIGLDLHNASATEHENRLGIRVIRAAMRTFQGVNQYSRSEFGDDRIANRAPIGSLVLRSHLHLGRIVDVAEVGSGPFLHPIGIGTDVSSTTFLATTTVVIGIREERISVLVPNERCQLVRTQPVPCLRLEFDLVALVRKILVPGIQGIHLGREPVEIARNTRSPKPFLGRVHHEVPETVRAIGNRGLRCLHDTLSAICLSILLRRLAHLVNVNTLSSDKKVSVRMVNNTIGTRHTIVGGTKSFLAEQLQIASTVIVVVEVLHAVIFTVFRIVQGRLRRSMRDDIAHLLDPDTRCRIFWRRHFACSHGKATAQRYSQ